MRNPPEGYYIGPDQWLPTLSNLYKSDGNFVYQLAVSDGTSWAPEFKIAEISDLQFTRPISREELLSYPNLVLILFDYPEPLQQESLLLHNQKKIGIKIDVQNHCQLFLKKIVAL